MYSRKNIRAYQPMTRYLPAESEERDTPVTPPPDYTGMAFYERKDSTDYPEAVILPAEPAVRSPIREEIEAAEEPSLSESAEASPTPLLMREEPFSANEADKREYSEPPPTAEPLPHPSPDGFREIEGTSGEAPEPPLLTPSWLRSLTLEDMLLFWLILLLLSGEPEDQIYLLLGLLLFTGR